MKKISIFTDIYKSPQKVFTLRELSLRYPNLKYVNLKRQINNLVLTNKLLNPVRGIYLKDDYKLAELACKIYTPSYVSLETVLTKFGIIFQKYDSVFVISHVNRNLSVETNKIIYKRLRNEILINSFGVKNNNEYFEATVERAFTDAVYLYRNYHFDNLSGLNWDIVVELVKIYKNKAMEKRINSYYKLYKNEYV